MTDRITVNTSALSAWAAKLDAVSDSLADAAGLLGRIDTSEEWWRRVDYDRSFRLRDEDSRRSMSNFKSAVSEWQSALKRYDSRIQHLAADVRDAGKAFESAEKSVSSAISDLLNGTADAGGTGAVQGGHYDSDTDWSDLFRQSWEKVIGSAKWIGEQVSDAIASWYNDYQQKGTTYKVIQTLLAGGKIVGSTVATIAAWCAAGVISVGSLGTGAPISIPMAALISGYSVNTIANSFADIANCWNGNVDQVGEVNYLKSFCSNIFGAIGDLAGHREVGEKAGEILYSAGELATLVSSVTNAFKGVQSAVSKAGSVKNFISQTMSGADDFWYLINDVDLSDLAYQTKLFKYANPSLKDNVSNVKSVISDALDIAKTIFGVF